MHEGSLEWMDDCQIVVKAATGRQISSGGRFNSSGNRRDSGGSPGQEQPEARPRRPLQVQKQPEARSRRQLEFQDHQGSLQLLAASPRRALQQQQPAAREQLRVPPRRYEELGARPRSRPQELPAQAAVGQEQLLVGARSRRQPLFVVHEQLDVPVREQMEQTGALVAMPQLVRAPSPPRQLNRKFGCGGAMVKTGKSKNALAFSEILRYAELNESVLFV